MSKQTDYGKIVQSDKFQALLGAKKRFILPMTVFFLVYYFALPVLTAYAKVLNRPAIGSISWAWIFAFSQFVMTWVLCGIYTGRAAKFDEQAKAVIEEGK